MSSAFIYQHAKEIPVFMMLLAALPIGISGAANYQSEVTIAQPQPQNITATQENIERWSGSISYRDSYIRGSGKPDAVPCVRYYLLLLY